MAAEAGGARGFIDSHAHLADAAFDSDRDAVIQRARDAGALRVVCIGSGSGADNPLEAASASEQLRNAHPGFVSYTAGVHPHDASGFDAALHMDALRSHVHKGAVALGECGLDYHYDNSPRDLQRAAFLAQLQLAAELQVPVVVHTRDAEADTRAMMADAAAAGVRGVLHCFTGTADFAAAAIACGWYVSFSGIVTFRKWSDDDLLRAVPAHRILAESDSPYLAPVPHRGLRNEPAWVGFTVERLADARDTDAAEMARQVARNARDLFGLASTSRTPV